ncbi:MAG: TatD family hydrolase [Gammaproteobacteria bacterium]
MLIDSHVHFDDPRFDVDRNAVYQRALDAGVEAMIIPAVTAESWGRTKEIADQYSHVFPAYGLHPYFIDQHKQQDFALLREWLKKEKPVAVGEAGLDYYLKDLDQIKQQDFFETQLEIAKEFDLPIIIHARKAVEDVIKTIKKIDHKKGMIHSFNGSLQQAEQLIESGYFLSFGGAATFAGSKNIRSLIKKLPLERLLLETDAPDQPDAQHQGERNEPAFMVEILDTFVALRSESKDEIVLQTKRNTIDLFDLKFRVRKR